MTPDLPTTEDGDDALPENDSVQGDGSHEQRSLTISSGQHGQRIDKVLVSMAPEFSRSHLQGLLQRGHVLLDGQAPANAARKLRVGQQLSIELVPTAESLAFRPETMALNLVFEDEHLLVIDKPVGLVVHPAPGNWSGTLLNGLLAHHAEAARLPRAGIVHRLDKDTSGLMVVAKSLPAMTALVRAISAREVRRIYLALAHGAPAWQEMRIETSIARDPLSRLRMAVLATGKPARTDVELLASTSSRPGVAAGYCALRCRLHTGRTHQIRVHLASRGHPLLSDATYGGRPALGLTRQALHAAELGFAHPLSGQDMNFTAALHPDMAAAWDKVMPADPAD